MFKFWLNNFYFFICLDAKLLIKFLYLNYAKTSFSIDNMTNSFNLSSDIIFVRPLLTTTEDFWYNLFSIDNMTKSI